MATSGGELMSKKATKIWDFFRIQADYSQQRSWSSRNDKKKIGVYKIQSSGSISKIKVVKTFIEEISRQLAFLHLILLTKLFEINIIMISAHK